MKPVLAFRHVAHEPLGLLEKVLRDSGMVYSYVDLFDSPPRVFAPEQISGLVVLGGPMGVYETEQHPYLAAELRWIEHAVAAGLPVLGVCLGSQLIAAALGSQVYPSGTKEIGWSEIQLTAHALDDALFCNAPRRFNVLQWHGDTFELPHGAVRLARGQGCENQAFRFGETVYALQFHLEATQAIIDDWFTRDDNCSYISDVEGLDPGAVRGESPQRLEELSPTARSILGRFALLCRERQGS